MDWLKGMNAVITHIEENLEQPIAYESLSRIVGCSVYEFSRIFSFMAGMSVSEYIRRRRLSQAVFDIQNSSGKIIDIALKYCWESPTAFARAFKELHGTTPTSARKTGVALKTYPPVSFILTIKGVNAMDFRIEKRDSFQIMGLCGIHDVNVANWTKKWEENNGTPALWRKFQNECDERLKNKNGESYYTAPFWKVGVYDYSADINNRSAIIGAEFKGDLLDGMELKTIPAAMWAVFSFTSHSKTHIPEAWTRVVTEWLPASQFKRNTSVPSMDVFPPKNDSKDYTWEIWFPVLNK